MSFRRRSKRIRAEGGSTDRVADELCRLVAAVVGRYTMLTVLAPDGNAVHAGAGGARGCARRRGLRRAR